MKNIVLFAALAASLMACSTVQQPPAQVGLANPASQYCIEQGGRLEIKDEHSGQVGYCHLPDGSIVEEWALFRQQPGQCVAEEAKKLIGKSGSLPQSEIKQRTQAKIVRSVHPSQPVTMDYRADRVTVTIDPNSNKIVQASCG